MYEAEKYDAWEHQIWNTAATKRGVCMDYWADWTKCVQYVKATYPYKKSFVWKRKDYCWKQHDNYYHCKQEK